MPKNIELENIVLSAMVEYLGEGSARYNIFLNFVGVRLNSSKEELLRVMTEDRLDQEYMIEVSLSHLL